MADHGTFYWNELNTRDVESAKKFYEKAIGWTFDGMPMGEMGTYWVANANGKPVGGVFNMDGMGIPKEVPEHWLSYLAVDDIDKRVKKAKDAGAEIMREPFDVPEVGRIAILKQPDGAVIGWITPVPQAGS
jgi:predicted enzyme related to lactoylglutathione lyase